MSGTSQGTLPIGAPAGESAPISPVVPPFTPPPPGSTIADLNAAKAAAAANGAAAVMFLAEVFTGEEYDITERVQAAAELLQFLAKGPF